MVGTLLPNWLKKRAELSPERVAVYYDGMAYTFKEVYEKSLEYGRAFYQKGIRKGNKVGILQGNSIDMVITIHACMLIGAEMVLFNSRLSSKELLWQLEDSDVKMVISDGQLVYLLEGYDLRKVLSIQDIKPVFAETDDIHLLVSEIELERPATYMYTSGTTGNPKAVIQSYENHWWSAVGSMLNLGLHEKDVWLCTVPLFHISGLSIIMRSVIYGMSIVLHTHFDEKKVNDAIRNQNITIASVVTTMVNRLLLELKGEMYPSSFRCMLLGGGPAPLSVLEACREKRIPVYQTYGMTETSSQIATLSPEYSIAKLGSAGKALFPSQLKIVNGKNGADANEVGEIVVKGPNVTRGYEGNKEATDAAYTVDGWFKTGDMGYLDQEGFLYVVDRRSDLIISGGENVYPAEIEAVLCKHPSVLEAGVAGVPDDTWGMIPIAFVVLKKAACTVEELLDHCRDHLAGYKRPKEIFVVKELPKNASNKIVRRKLINLLENAEKKEG